MKYTGAALHLNLKVNAGGSVRVALLDEYDQPLPYRNIADCVPITGDHIDQKVTWQSGSEVGFWAGQAIKLRFEMVDAHLYAFQFTGE